MTTVNPVEQKNLGRLRCFRNFLKDRLELEESEMPEECEWSDMANMICALALRRGLLTCEQVDQILEIQVNSEIKKRVGEIAVDLRYLTTEQVDKLLEIQALDKELVFGQQLVLSDMLDLHTLLGMMSEFLETTANEKVASPEVKPMAATCE